jgi:flavodoxin
MKYKMQVLYYSKKGNTEKMAQAIARDQKTKSDKIPPAYPVEGQKLLIVGLEMGGSVNKQVKDFCAGLTPQRTKNLAFFITGKVDGLNGLKEMIASTGINVLDDIHVSAVKNGLFHSKPKDEDIKAVVEWASKIVDSLE